MLLLAMADDMTEAGQVRMSRSVYAARLGRTERRISDRLEQAVKAGLLDRVEKGAPGRYPLYAALLASPTGERVRSRYSTPWPDEDERGTDRRHTSEQERGTDRRHTNAGRSAAPVTRRTGVTPSPRSEGARAPGARVSRISNNPPTVTGLPAGPASAPSPALNDEEAGNATVLRWCSRHQRGSS